MVYKQSKRHVKGSWTRVLVQEKKPGASLHSTVKFTSTVLRWQVSDQRFMKDKLSGATSEMCALSDTIDDAKGKNALRELVPQS